MEADAEQGGALTGVDGHHGEHLRQRQHSEGDAARDALRLGQQALAAAFRCGLNAAQPVLTRCSGDTESQSRG